MYQSVTYLLTYIDGMEAAVWIELTVPPRLISVYDIRDLFTMS
jgi:hypothetical protein